MQNTLRFVIRTNSVRIFQKYNQSDIILNRKFHMILCCCVNINIKLGQRVAENCCGEPDQGSVGRDESWDEDWTRTNYFRSSYGALSPIKILSESTFFNMLQVTCCKFLQMIFLRMIERIEAGFRIFPEGNKRSYSTVVDERLSYQTRDRRYSTMY